MLGVIYLFGIVSDWKLSLLSKSHVYHILCVYCVYIQRAIKQFFNSFFGIFQWQFVEGNKNTLSSRGNIRLLVLKNTPCTGVQHIHVAITSVISPQMVFKAEFSQKKEIKKTVRNLIIKITTKTNIGD